VARGAWWRGAASALIAEVEDRALAGEAVGLLLSARRERLLERSQHPSPRRPVESSAPHLTSDSSARLFTTCGSTRSVKSQIDVNGPPPLRAAIIERTAPSPTFFTAFSPKRILPSTTAKSVRDEFTSGGSTSIPSSSQALT
jgi:hypothetical protein